MSILKDVIQTLCAKKCVLCSRVKTMHAHQDPDHHICDRCFKRLCYLGQLDTVVMDDRDVVKILWEPRFSKK